MLRTQTRIVTVVLFLFHGFCWATSTTDPPPFAHVQTDRAAYRLGETIWYRVHTARAPSVRVTLESDSGTVVSEAAKGSPESAELSGSFFLSEELPGGTYSVVARSGANVLHALPIETYALVVPELELDLTIIGRVHYPGDTLLATFRAQDSRGRPIVGVRLEYLATFGPLRIRERGGLTNADGEALIRVPIPRETSHSGHLSVGLKTSKGRAAVARQVTISASVARVDAFPEGGSIVSGHSHRLGLLVRDLDGRPTAAEGRVVDDRGKTINSFLADERGVATVLVPYADGRRYVVRIERPARVRRSFPLPGPTGHPYSVRLDRNEKKLVVELRCERETSGKHPTVLLEAGGRVVERRSVTVPQVRKGSAPVVRLQIDLHAKPSLKSEALGWLHVTDDDRAFVKRPVFLGKPAALEVKIEPSSATPLLPGNEVQIEVRTSRGGVPVPANLGLSIFQGPTVGMPDMVARSHFAAHRLGGFDVPASLLEEDDNTQRHREAYLLVHGAYAFPAKGEPLTDSESIVALDAGKRLPPAVASRGQAARAADAPRHRTVVRPAGFERLLERARYAQSPSPAAGARTVELLVKRERLLRVHGLGRPARSWPQRVRVPGTKVDCRTTLYWHPELRTNSQGRTRISFRLNHLVSDLSWVARGFGDDATALSAEGTVRPEPGFRTRFVFPRHLHVGDLVDLWLDVGVTDGRRARLEVEAQAPACLKPLLRTRLTYDPRKDAREHRFRFQVVDIPSVGASPWKEFEFKMVAKRDLYREVHRRPFTVSHREVELTMGERGQAQGTRTVSLRLPKTSVPGSATVSASVSPAVVTEAMQAHVRLLRTPTGCFEQWTTKNLLNLVLLDHLLQWGSEPRILEQAYRYVEEGYERLLKHWDVKTGGFALFAGREPHIPSTLVAIRQLLLYDELFEGRGVAELEAAVSWLAREKLSPSQALYLTHELHKAGRLWSGSLAVLRQRQHSLYEAALVAGCVASWPGDWPQGAEWRKLAPRTQHLGSLLDKLIPRLTANQEDPDSTGIMGSSGASLGPQILAVSALAAKEGNRPDAARQLLTALARSMSLGAPTRSLAEGIYAWTRLDSRMPAKSFPVEFTVNPGGSQRVLAMPSAVRPLLFRRHLNTLPGETAELSVSIEADEPKPYDLRCTYRTDKPRSAADAPYALSCRGPALLKIQEMGELHVTVTPRESTRSSQVVARIALPGGCSLNEDSLRQAVLARKFSHWEVKSGSLDLYWDQPPRNVVRISFQVQGMVAGLYESRPSMIYPYYEPGKEYFAQPWKLRVLAHSFDFFSG